MSKVKKNIFIILYCYIPTRNLNRMVIHQQIKMLIGVNNTFLLRKILQFVCVQQIDENLLISFS